MYLLYSSSLHI